MKIVRMWSASVFTYVSAGSSITKRTVTRVIRFQGHLKGHVKNYLYDSLGLSRPELEPNPDLPHARRMDCYLS